MGWTKLLLVSDTTIVGPSNRGTAGCGKPDESTLVIYRCIGRLLGIGVGVLQTVIALTRVSRARNTWSSDRPRNPFTVLFSLTVSTPTESIWHVPNALGAASAGAAAHARIPAAQRTIAMRPRGGFLRSRSICRTPANSPVGFDLLPKVGA